MVVTAWLAATLGVLGCDALGGYPVETVINAAHHGVRGEDGKLPRYGEPEEARFFENDLGWKIALTEGFVVSTAVKIERCDGEGVVMNLPFGPLPESFLDQDINATDFAILDLEPGEYCNLIVEYGRYQSGVAAMAKDVPFSVEDPAHAEGTTLWLSGYADKDDGKGGTITKAFSFRSDQTIIVNLSLATLEEDGGPWTIRGDEPGLRNLTIAKTYDDFFAGVDFETIDKPTFEAELPKRLAAQTRVVSGSTIY